MSILLTFAFQSIFYAQNSTIIDTLSYEEEIKWYKEKIRKQSYNDIEKALKYCDYSIKLSFNKNKKDLAGIYLEKGNIYRCSGVFDSVITNLNKAIEISIENDFKKVLGASYRVYGDLHDDMGNEKYSLEYYIKAMNILENLDDELLIAELNYSMGNLHIHKDDEKALEYFNMSLEYAKKMNNKGLMASIYNATIPIYYNKNEKTIALNNLKIAFKLVENENMMRTMSAITRNLGDAYLIHNQLDSALFYIKKAMSIKSENNINSGLNFNYLSLAKAYDVSKEDDSVMHYINKAIIFCETKNLSKDLIDIYNFNYKYYLAKNNFNKAYTFSTKYYTLKDSLQNEDIKRQLGQLDIEHKLEAKEHELELVNQENKLKKIEYERQKRINWLLGGGIFLLTFSCFLLINRFFTNKKNNKLLTKSLYEKEVLLKEVHHRVKNNLQLVSSFFNLQASHGGENNSDDDFINKIQAKIHSIALIHEKLYKTNDFSSIDMKCYFTELLVFLKKTYSLTSKKIEIVTDIEEVNLSVAQLSPCGLIINEVITNSIKHAFPNNQSGKIEFNASVKNNVCCILIKDNGVGISNINTKSPSLGLKLINGLVNQIGGNITVDNLDGAIFKIEFNVD